MSDEEFFLTVDEDMLKKKKHVCAQDLREEELKKEGKIYFRIGRAIFVIDIVEHEPTEDQIIGSPLGTAIAMGGQEIDAKTQKVIKEIFLPTGCLRIRIEGDPDAGLTDIADEVRLTGYRGGLDDVTVNKYHLKTVHGDVFEVIRHLLDLAVWELGSHCVKFVPKEDEEGWMTRMDDEILRDELKSIFGRLEEIVDDLEKRTPKHYAIRF